MRMLVEHSVGNGPAIASLAKTPSSVSACGRSTFSHEGRREPTEGSRLHPLLPSWEKVPEGRMRGRHQFNQFRASGDDQNQKPRRNDQ